MFLPNNERWYSYDWGSAHILVLDTEMPFTPGTPQYAFAQADLAAHQSSAWRIVALQRPAYSSSTASASSIPVRTYLTPLFEQQNVKLVLSGNSHNYERTYPLIGGTPTTGGVTYVVSGNGGNGFNTFQLAQPSWSAYRQASYYGYLRVTVGPSSIQVNEIRADTGTVIDSTTIAGQADTTQPSQPTNLTATAPSSTRVDLGWTASTDNVGVSGYDVYRDGTLLDSVGAVTTYTDGTVQPNTTYSYSVQARDAAGNVSLMSDPAQVTTPPAARTSRTSSRASRA